MMPFLLLQQISYLLVSHSVFYLELESSAVQQCALFWKHYNVAQILSVGQTLMRHSGTASSEVISAELCFQAKLEPGIRAGATAHNLLFFKCSTETQYIKNIHHLSWFECHHSRLRYRDQHNVQPPL